MLLKWERRRFFDETRKEYEKLADHIGQFPAVMISPYDRDLISEGSELRRKWMDGIIAQFDRRYLEHAFRNTARVLAQRNALLKNMAEHRLFDRESIDVWNDQLVDLGHKIFEKRKLPFWRNLSPFFSVIIRCDWYRSGRGSHWSTNLSCMMRR